MTRWVFAALAEDSALDVDAVALSEAVVDFSAEGEDAVELGVGGLEGADVGDLEFEVRAAPGGEYVLRDEGVLAEFVPGALVVFGDAAGAGRFLPGAGEGVSALGIRLV